jgi:hypothetical protein
MRQKKQPTFQREVLRAVIVIAICGICACDRDNTGTRRLTTAQRAEREYRRKLLEKVKKGWDGNADAATKIDRSRLGRSQQ